MTGGTTGGMSARLLEVRGLSVALPAGADRSHAVRDIDLHLDAGEILCVVGESGSGKSVTALVELKAVDSSYPMLGEVALDEVVGDSDATPFEVSVVGQPCAARTHLPKQFIDGAIRLAVGADQRCRSSAQHRRCPNHNARVLTGPNDGARSEVQCLGPQLLECQPKRQPRIAVVEDR
mgnify:CR=1 FL=1